MDVRDARGPVERAWSALGGICNPSYFSSWGWVETWLDTLPEHARVELLLIQDALGPRLAALVGVRRGLERRIVYRRRGYLQATGDADLDVILPEYITPWMRSPDDNIADILLRPELADIGELRLRLVPQALVAHLQVPPGWFGGRVTQTPSHWVNLEALRAQARDSQSVLSANRRAQLRQSLRHYGGAQKIRLKEAGTSSEALQMLERLTELHQREWRRRGQPGAFSHPYFCRFHRALIERRFSHGEIQLLEVTGGDRPLGYLYNFLHANQVLFYQSGFDYGSSNQARPGLVCHHLAIEHNLAAGRQRYNFLGGNHGYKATLATDQDMLCTVELVRDTPGARLERLARRWLGRTTRNKNECPLENS